jgi:hypothetical protein
MLLKNHNVIYLYGEQCLAYVFDNPLCCSFSVLSRCECYVYLTNYSDKYIKNLFTFVQEKLILLLT